MGRRPAVNRGQAIRIARRMLGQDFVLPTERDEVARGYLRAVGADVCFDEEKWHAQLGCYCEPAGPCEIECVDGCQDVNHAAQAR